MGWRRQGLSLRWKLALGSALILAVMLTVLVINNVGLMEASLEEQVEVRQRELAVLLNASIAPSMAELNYGPILGVFAASRRDEGISYFALFDRNNKLVAGEGWPADKPLPAVDERLDPRSESQRFDTEIPIFIGAQTYGRLQFGISTEFLQAARERLVRQSFAIATAEIALSIVLLMLLGIWLTRHLSTLKAASMAVGQGNFDISVEVDSQDEVGRVARAFNTMTREIKQRMTELGESEARFRSLTALSADWYWEQDVDGRFVSFQGGAEGFAPLFERDLLGKQLHEIDCVRLADELLASYQAQWAAHLPFRDLEYEYVGAGGGSAFMSISGAPFFDSEGAFSGYRGVGKDVTQRKQVELALVHSERLLRLSQGAAQIGSYAIDLTTGRWESSPLLDDILGIDAAFERDIPNWEGLLHPDDRQRVKDDFRSTLANGMAFSREYRIVRQRDGEIRWVVAWGDYETDSAGCPILQVGAIQDITQVKNHAQQLEHIAHYDAVTGLPNRALLADRLQQAMSRVQRQGRSLAVGLLDLDGFKAVNDIHGHSVGDALLVALAQRMKAALREGDTLSHIGGDEFVVVLVDLAQPGDCEPILTRLLQATAESVVVGECTLRVSSSIGVTIYPQDDVDADLLVRHADQAMYQAKQAGKNRFHLFDVAHDVALQARRETLERIGCAITRREFVLHYQPKVNMRTGAVVGAEALIRWQHPERGLLPPAAFLPDIEEHPVSIALGEWVIDTALTQMAHWHAAGLKIPVSVNVGARQLQNGDFCRRLSELLDAHPDVEPGCLQLEILETSALEDTAYVSEVMHTCRALGVSFALDDFGTGYSSLSYLKRLPAGALKVDQSFVRDMLDDPNDLAIIKGIIGLAAAFEREVIAEGVETFAHGEMLLRIGCEQAQGYGIARPMPPEVLPAWVDRWQTAASWSA